MGRFFDDAVVRRLAWQTQVEYSIASMSDSEKTRQASAALHHITHQTPYWIDAADADWMKVYPCIRISTISRLFDHHKGAPEYRSQGYETVRVAIYSLLIAAWGYC